MQFSPLCHLVASHHDERSHGLFSGLGIVPGVDDATAVAIPVRNISLIVGISSVIQSLVRAVAWGLLLAAIFGRRE